MTKFKAPDSSPLSGLTGNVLSAVTFLSAYLQLHFDGPYLTAYVWPDVHIGGTTHSFGTPGYRDAICDQIDKLVTSVCEVPDEKIALHFSDQSSIEISLRQKDRVKGEAVMFQDPQRKVWNVW